MTEPNVNSSACRGKPRMPMVSPAELLARDGWTRTLIGWREQDRIRKTFMGRRLKIQ